MDIVVNLKPRLSPLVPRENSAACEKQAHCSDQSCAQQLVILVLSLSKNRRCIFNTQVRLKIAHLVEHTTPCLCNFWSDRKKAVLTDGFKEKSWCAGVKYGFLFRCNVEK